MSKPLLSIIYSYYNQPEMLVKIVEIINTYSKEIREEIEVIIVDDGSMIKPLEKPLFKCLYRCFRIMEDIGFNNGGSKNIGILNAEGSWCMIMDLDHWFSEKNIDKLLKKIRRTHKERWYMFYRLRNGYETIKHNPNLKLIRSEIIKNNLYDEDFSGYYGYEDKYQLHLLTDKYGKPKILKRILIDVSTDQSASTISQTNRNLDRNKELLRKKIENEIPYSREFFRTPYEELFTEELLS